MAYVDEVMEQLGPLGDVTSIILFGAQGLFVAGDIFDFISWHDRLYFKVDETNLNDYEAAGSERFKPMPYYEVPEAVFDDPDQLAEWATTSIVIGHITAKKKKR